MRNVPSSSGACSTSSVSTRAVMAVRGEDDERVDAGLLPGPEQIVHPAVQRLAAHRGVAGVRPLGGGVHAVFDGRGAQDVEAGREIVGQPLDDDRVASQREMGAVLLAGADRHQEAGIALQDEADFVGHQRLQMTRRLHIVLAGCATAVAVAEWLHGNAGVWAWTAGAAALATAGLAVARGPRAIAAGLAALASLLLGAVVIAGVRQVRRIGGCWTES